MRIVFKIVGALAIISTVAIILVAIAPQSHSVIVLPMLYTSLAFIAIGLLAMIGHLNLSYTPSTEEKDRWRAHLWWGGPFVAGWYLVSVAGRRPDVAVETETESGQRRARGRVVGTIVLLTSACVSTFVAAKLGPELEVDGTTDRLIYLGSRLTASIVGSVVAVAFRLPARVAISALLPFWLFVLYEHRYSGWQLSLFAGLFLSLGVLLWRRLR